MIESLVGLAVIAVAAVRAKRSWDRAVDVGPGAARAPYDEGTPMGRIRSWLLFHPFMRAGGGSSDGIFFIPIFGNPHYDKKWFKLTVMKVYRLCRAVHEAKWWVLHRFHPSHRYNVVPTGLRPGYYDFDTRILHASMEMLKQYVECEGGAEPLAAFSASLRAAPDENAPEGACSGQADRQDEAVAIYRWWTVGRPADQKRRDDLTHRLYGGKRLKTRPVGDGTFHQVLFDGPTADERALREELWALEEKIAAEADAYMHRLVDIRASLWT
jgi:hypothetical protein